MEQTFNVTLTINWTLKIDNDLDTASDDLLYKSAFLKRFDSEIESVEDIEVDSITDEKILGIVTVIKDKSFVNPNKTAKECVEEYLETDYFQNPPTEFIDFEVEWITVEEERTEVIIDTDELSSD